MRAWFENLAPRERLVVTVGAVVAGLILFWGTGALSAGLGR